MESEEDVYLVLWDFAVERVYYETYTLSDVKGGLPFDLLVKKERNVRGY